MNTPRAPSFAELLDWLEGRLPPDQALAVSQRLSLGGPASQADLAWLKAFQAASHSARLAVPPPSVRHTLRQRFAARQAGLPRPPPLFRRWLAALSFDSRRQAASADLRSAAADGRERQLIYKTESAEIVLNLQPGRAGQAAAVFGQVFSLAEAPAAPLSVQFLRDGQSAALTATDDLGEFAVAGLPAGSYEVIISAADYELVLPAVPIDA